MKVLFMVLNEKAALDCDDVSLTLYKFKIEPWLYIKHIDILSAFRLRWLFLFRYSFIFILCRFLFWLQGWCCRKSLAPKRKPQKPWPLSSIQDLLRPHQGRHTSYESAKRLMLFWNVEAFLRCFCAEVSQCQALLLSHCLTMSLPLRWWVSVFLSSSWPRWCSCYLRGSSTVRQTAVELLLSSSIPCLRAEEVDCKIW